MCRWLPFLALIVCMGCRHKVEVAIAYQPNDSVFQYHGRLLKNDGSVALIGSASGVQFNVSGDSTELKVKSDNATRNYFSLAIDDAYYERYKIGGDSINTISIALLEDKNKSHEIGLYKSTEAANGTVSFYGAKAQNISALKIKSKASIEFIGNSITCGMGADASKIPCGEGEWFDQHNAYLAYGPRVARSLNADYVLSSVSGIGMYRNWNDENRTEPVMPEVYDNLFLNTDTTYKYTFDYTPNVICICLGTNDLSDGDGVRSRLSFDREKFIGNFTAFVKHLFEKNPRAKMALLNSPMVSGNKGNVLLECLLEVKAHFENNREISIFQFEEMQPNGCSFHPDSADHKIMADQLKPFLKTILE